MEQWDVTRTGLCIWPWIWKETVQGGFLFVCLFEKYVKVAISLMAYFGLNIFEWDNLKSEDSQIHWTWLGWFFLKIAKQTF